jgi:hypothetical protein
LRAGEYARSLTAIEMTILVWRKQMERQLQCTLIGKQFQIG